MANTGRVEKQQRDVNPNSPTYNQVRWVDAGYTDLISCPIPTTYRSAAISGTITKNNCPSGQFGSSVPFTVAYGQFTSQLSQADADQQAQAYFDANKQTYANTNGTCSSDPGTQWLPQYTATGRQFGCFSGLMYDTDDPARTRIATTEECLSYSPTTSATGVPCPIC